MTREEWLAQFKAEYGREPTPAEFTQARDAGSWSVNLGPIGPGTAEIDPATPLSARGRWLADFRAHHDRVPSAQEFAEAKASGFVSQVTAPLPGGVTAGDTQTGPGPSSVSPGANPDPAEADHHRGALPPLAVTRTQPTDVDASSRVAARHRTGWYRRWWAFVIYAVVLALIAAGVGFGIPGTSIHGLLNKPKSAAANADAGQSESQTRVTSMPSSVPSCPKRWTPVTWASWNGGNTLVCSSSGQSGYHVNITDGSRSLSTDKAQTMPTGGYSATFDDGSSAVVAFGGSMTQLTAAGATKAFVTSQAWANGVGTGFTAVPGSSVSSCPAGSYPFSMSLWGNHWLLTCGASQSTPSSFFYYDGTLIATGGSMTNDSGQFCGYAQAGTTVCQNAQMVSTAGFFGPKTTYPTQSSYLPGVGVTNSAEVQGGSSGADAQAGIDAQIKQDTPYAETYLLGQWTPQLSAKWDGVSWQGKTWTSADILNQFQGFKQKYSTAMMLRSSDWSSLGLSGHEWITMVAGIAFGSYTDANKWCYTQGFGPDDCFAVQLGHGAADSTAKSWQPKDFGG